jgi:peptide/nickel transport system permease protein
MVRRVMVRVLRGGGVRVGLFWIAVLVLMAVGAPLLASSHPLLMKTEAGWSSPWLKHLRPQDVTLLAVSGAALVLLPWRLAALRTRFLLLLAVAAGAGALSAWLVDPPQAVVHSRYREMAEEGRIEEAYHALVPYSPGDNLRDHPDSALQPPSWAHPLGTTDQGADLFAHMVYGARIALAIGFISTGIAMAVGIVIGGVMGYFAGPVDLFGMRLVEIFRAVPRLFLLLAFVAAFEANLYMLMVIIGLTDWGSHALFLRGEFLRLRRQPFVEAARACGLPVGRVLFRHMLPNGVAPLLVTASLSVAGAILAESVLSFLGVGLVEMESWGKLLSDALGVGGAFYWWIALYPGLAIFLTVFAYVLVGEGMRDALDPKTAEEG